MPISSKRISFSYSFINILASYSLNKVWLKRSYKIRCANLNNLKFNALSLVTRLDTRNNFAIVYSYNSVILGICKISNLKQDLVFGSCITMASTQNYFQNLI